MRVPELQTAGRTELVGGDDDELESWLTRSSALAGDTVLSSVVYIPA